MDRTELLAPFERLLAAACSTATVRAIEQGGDPSALWRELEASGFLDALVPESCGGSGLALADIAPILMACGRFALPVPLGDTIAGRYLLALNGVTPPSGPITLASGHDRKVATDAWPVLRTHQLHAEGESLRLSLADGQDGGHWTAPVAETCRLLGALVRAAAIAGASQWLLDASLAYANDRVQFGKPVGRQQAIQQQLAVMAEQCVAAKMAVEFACAAGLPCELAPIAIAKAITSAAAPQIIATAHAVHGAIGISREHDLHLFTRRLHSWRLDHGSEGYWEERLGAQRLTAAATSVDWIRGLMAS